MTGSRRHDILGKKENNLSNIRALYRFENREELMHAEADQIVVTTTELLDVIWNHRSEKMEARSRQDFTKYDIDFKK